MQPLGNLRPLWLDASSATEAQLQRACRPLRNYEYITTLPHRRLCVYTSARPSLRLGESHRLVDLDKGIKHAHSRPLTRRLTATNAIAPMLAHLARPQYHFLGQYIP